MAGLQGGPRPQGSSLELQAAILASRAGDPAVEKRAYLQLDDGVEVDDAAGHVLTASGDRSVKLWEGASCVRTYQGHQDAVRSLALMPQVGFLSVSQAPPRAARTRGGRAAPPACLRLRPSPPPPPAAAASRCR